MRETIIKNSGLFLFESLLLIVLGIFAVAIPQLFTLSIELLIGSLFVLSGLVQGFRVLKSGFIEGFWPGFIAAILSIVIGVYLLAYPVNGIIALTLLLAIFFLFQGVAQIVMGFNIRSTPGSTWLIFSGIITLVLSYLIWSGLPGTAAWVIGLLVGINLLVTGFSLFFMWAGARKSH